MQRLPKYNHVEIYHLFVKLFTYLHNVLSCNTKAGKRNLPDKFIKEIWAIKRAVCFNICYQLTENLIGV